MAVDRDGNVYVADTLNQRLQMLDIATGKWMVWGKSGQRTGSQLGEFNQLTGVAVDSQGNVYVADYENHRIQKVKIERNEVDVEGNVTYSYTPTWSEWKKDGGGSGSGLGEFDEPYGVAVDSQGNIYVADSNNHRIQKLTVATSQWSKRGKDYDGPNIPDNGYGSDLGEFDYPTGVAIDPMGNVYVADYNNHRIQKLGKYLPLSAGESHSVALKPDSTVWTWGANTSGQLGLGDAGLETHHNTPMQVKKEDGTDFIAVQVAAGGSHTVVVDPAERVWTWGSNLVGQLGDGSAGSSRNKPYRVDSLADVIAIAAGTSHTAALKGDGTVWTWGSNGEGQLGLVNTNTPVAQPKQVMLADGTTPLIAKSIFAGYNQTLAIDRDGTLWMWGSQGNGENKFVPEKVTHRDHSEFKAVSASAGSRFTVALDTEGKVWTWGYNGTEGALGNGNSDNVTELYPLQVSGLTNVIATSAGSMHTLALKNDGTVWAWGFNKHGQLGNLSNVNSPVPVYVRNQDGNIFHDAIAIAAGGNYANHSLAMKDDGTIVAWGANNVGQLGNAKNVNKNYAEDVQGLTFTVTFNSEDGSEVPRLTGIINDSKITAPEAPTRTGYTFDGWYKDTEYNEPWDFEVDTVTADLIVYAKWTENQTYAIAPISNQTLTELTAGYASGTQGTKTITITRTGTGDLENLSVVKSGTQAGNFEIAGPAVTKLDKDKPSTTLTLKAKDGLTAGTYTMMVTVKATNMTDVTSTVTQVVKAPSNPGPDPSLDPTPTIPTKEEIMVDVQAGEGGVISKTPITRTTEPNGTVKDEVILTSERAKEAVDQLKDKTDKSARIIIPDEKDKVSQVDVKLPSGAVITLAAGKANFEINTENVRIVIPNISLDGFNKDLYFRLVPIKQERERKALEERAKKEEQVREIAKDQEIKILGRPMTIETNMQGRPVALILPLKDSLPKNEVERQAILDNLVIFVEHSDGTKELIRGELVAYKQGELGIHFNINKFSTFTMVYLKGWKEYLAAQQQAEAGMHKPYIQGFVDGTFGPEKTVTRSQMAAMLARNLETDYKGSGTSSFKDTDAKHWAFQEMETVNHVGLMQGYEDGRFGAEDGVTRAEMAVIVDRWMAKQGKSNASTDHNTIYTDLADKHWAYEAIMRVQAYGIMEGYQSHTFKPDQKLTRAEAVKILNRLFDRGPLYGVESPSFTDVPNSHWAFYEIEEAAKAHQWVKDDQGRESKK